MKKVIFVISLLISQETYAKHSLEESINMVRLGGVNTKSLIVKYKKSKNKKIFSFWDFKNLKGFKEKPLFQNITKSKNKSLSYNKKYLEGFSELYLKKSLSEEKAIELLQDLYAQNNIEYAIFSPKASSAVLTFRNDKSKAENIPHEIPDFEPSQFYLEPAPVGVDARFAWSIPGGDGQNIKIIDIETGVNYKHREFNPFFYLSDLPEGKVDHGTAVAGILAAKKDGVGVTGIAHAAQLGFISRLFNNDDTWEEDGCGYDDVDCDERDSSPYHKGIARNLALAIEKLSRGDLLIIEMHSPGPRGEYIPVEYWNPIFEILKYATNVKGIHCVAVAGNGGDDLDHEDYRGAFDLEKRDSGCVIVGAALFKGEDRHYRAGFSNYGSRVDAFGYGESVVTTGYGHLFSGKNSMYTNVFGGTSSAAPIVGGAMASLLGIVKKKKSHLSPVRLRDALRKTGTQQKGNTDQRIGNLPDLKAAFNYLFL